MAAIWRVLHIPYWDTIGYAYSLTMFENDDIDFLSRRDNSTDSNKYKTEGFSNYEVRKKIIKVKTARIL
jgi:hypothetical protein